MVCFIVAELRFGIWALIKMPLEAEEQISDFIDPTQDIRSIRDGVVLQLNQVRQSGLVQFLHACVNVLEQDELQKIPLLLT